MTNWNESLVKLNVKETTLCSGMWFCQGGVYVVRGSLLWNFKLEDQTKESIFQLDAIAGLELLLL